MKKTYMVPFQAEETVWNSCVAKVEANSKEEAFQAVKKSIEESNPFRDFNAEWNGINTVTIECIETAGYGIGEDSGLTVEDVVEADERIKCEISNNQKLEKFECHDCGCFFMVAERNDFVCPNCESLKECEEEVYECEKCERSFTNEDIETFSPCVCKVCAQEENEFNIEAPENEIVQKMSFIKAHLPSLIGTRWTKATLEAHLQEKFSLSSKLDEIDESGCVSDHAFIIGISEDYGYIDIYFLKVPYGLKEIYITEVTVSAE